MPTLASRRMLVLTLLAVPLALAWLAETPPARAQEAPLLWSCEQAQRAFGESLGARSLMVALSPGGACWLDWNPLRAPACSASRSGADLVVDVAGRGQMMGLRWIVERGATEATLAGCRVGERPRDAEPSGYNSRDCTCRRSTLASAAVAWRKASNLDAGAALLMPHVDPLVLSGAPTVSGDDLEATYELAGLLDQRAGPGDAELAHRYALFAAERGHTEAAYLTGQDFEGGRGTAADPNAAATWYRRAAEGGSRRAMTALGILYQGGLGVTRDLAQALRWYRAAVELGSASGMLRLGLLFHHGQGVEQSSLDAYQWLFGASLSEDPATRDPARRELAAVGQTMTAADRAEAESRFRAWQKARKATAKTAPPR